MNEDTRQEALENIELIKELVIQTKKHIGNFGGKYICFIWGIFSLVGVAGQRLFIPHGPLMGVWWMTLALVAGLATYLTVKKHLKSQPERTQHNYIKYFLQFWMPLLLLGYTLATFVALLPSISNHYISPVILLVVSTGYLMIGFMFYKGILYMGIIGYITSVISAIYFLEFSDIILGVLFGVGLIIIGLVINKQWKNT